MPELLVAILVLGFVLSGLYQGLDNLQTTSSGAHERLVNLDEARVLIETLSKDVRTATRLTPTSPPLEYADYRRVIFYARLNTTGQPVQITISVDAEGRLVESIIDPTCAVPLDPCPDGNYVYTSTPRRRIVGRWLANTGAIFTYYGLNDDGTVSTIVPSPASAPLTPIQLGNVRAVEIDLSIRRTPTSSAPPTRLVTRVRLPNV